ncbi:Protein of unknown function [Bacillus toyonensis]|nr:Protein of unknown function [Bacillus toyonensis]
MDENVSKS